jgi:hypothetical protein
MRVMPFLYTLNFGPLKEEDYGNMEMLIILDFNLSLRILPQKD